MILTVTLNAAIDKRYVVEDLVPHTVMRVRECEYSAGGKGLNVARVAHRAGADVLATGFLGGHAGAYVAQALTDEGIAHDFVTVAGESRSCLNVVDARTGSSTELLEPGITVADPDLRRFAARYEHLLAGAEVVVLSGSLPAGCPPDGYAALVQRAHELGVRVYVDTSGAALRHALGAGPSFVKPNEDEIAALVGEGPLDVEGAVRAARRLHERDGIGQVAVSLGSRGAVCVSEHGAWWARPPRVAVANTVGCGDAFVGAYAVAESRGDAPAERLAYAVAVSAASAMSPRTGWFDPHDLATVVADGVTVEPV